MPKRRKALSNQSINQSTNRRENESKQTLQPTLLLTDEYEFNKRQMDEGKIRKNTFLAQVTKKLQGEKHFIQKEISGRWKILCRKYKAVKDGNKK